MIADEVQQEGTVDHTPVYVREVVKRALELSATAIVLVHNHPSGDPTPSRADIDMKQATAIMFQPADRRLFFQECRGGAIVALQAEINGLTLEMIGMLGAADLAIMTR